MASATGARDLQRLKVSGYPLSRALLRLACHCLCAPPVRRGHRNPAHRAPHTRTPSQSSSGAAERGARSKSRSLGVV
eukprot:939118-Prymnesium_polylepis.1